MAKYRIPFMVSGSIYVEYDPDYKISERYPERHLESLVTDRFYKRIKNCIANPLGDAKVLDVIIDSVECINTEEQE